MNMHKLISVVGDRQTMREFADDIKAFRRAFRREIREAFADAYLENSNAYSVSRIARFLANCHEGNIIALDKGKKISCQPVLGCFSLNVSPKDWDAKEFIRITGKRYV